jgi:hypothetical protein
MIYCPACNNEVYIIAGDIVFAACTRCVMVSEIDRNTGRLIDLPVYLTIMDLQHPFYFHPSSADRTLHGRRDS